MFCIYVGIIIIELLVDRLFSFVYDFMYRKSF